MGACVEAPPPAPPGAPADGRAVAVPSAPPAPASAPEGPHCEITGFWRDADHDGAWVTLSGTVSASGPGMLLLDLVDPDTEQIVWGFSCDAAGPFSILAPAALGAVHLKVWLDASGDGPSDDDARGQIDGLRIDAADVGGLEVSVSLP